MAKEMVKITLLNPNELRVGEKVQNFYHNTAYQVVEVKNGMAKMKNLATNKVETWNACNNRHFTREPQLSLFKS